MTDEELRRLLQESFEPIGDAPPSRDLWPSIAAHRPPRTVPPWFDVALTAAILGAFLIRPDWVVLVASLF